MKTSRAHRLTALLGIVAMLASIFYVPAAAAFAKLPGEVAFAAHAQAGHVPGTRSPAAHNGKHAAAASHAAAIPSHPCPHSKCPDCPKHGGDLAGCLVKCFQSSAATPPSAVAGITPPLTNTPKTPVAAPLVTGTSVPPLLRPPIA